MIPTKARETRKMKLFKLSKNLERKYKEVKCRECTVVVTPMDFAKILGRFTKVKIQYERSSKSKPKQTNIVSPNSRLKENGMVQLHRQAYNAHPAQKLLGQKKSKANPPMSTSNVLKENNGLKKPQKIADSEYSNKMLMKSHKIKYYGVVFDKPSAEKKVDIQNKISLQDLVSDINSSILPAEDWSIDYFPKNGEPKDDKIYDRIAAELEDLMYNEKTKISSNVKDSKNDEFPSILDILNENTKDVTSKISDPATSLNLESSDVEAMLLGNTTTETTAMEVDASINSITDKATQPIIKVEEDNKTEVPSTMDDNPESPSILDEHVQKDASSTDITKMTIEHEKSEPATSQTNHIDENDNTNKNNNNTISKTEVTQIIFKKSVNGTSCKSVICRKNLKYSISILGKSVQLLGAPTHISSLEDLQVLLQIVEESELNSLYVLH